MRKRGFTLIELIVVIAIIGILAAILVPALVGYIKKSKMTSANAAAKSIYNASQAALTDLASQSIAPTDTLGDEEHTIIFNAGDAFTKDTAENIYKYKVHDYYEKVANFGQVRIKIDDLATVAVGLVDGNGYPGGHPNQILIEDYASCHGTSAANALTYAETGSV